MTAVDEPALLAEARELFARRQPALAQARPAAASVRPAYQAMVRAAAGRDVGMQRWVGRP